MRYLIKYPVPYYLLSNKSAQNTHTAQYPWYTVNAVLKLLRMFTSFKASFQHLVTSYEILTFFPDIKLVRKTDRMTGPNTDRK